MHGNGALDPAVLLVGRGDHDAVPRHEDPRLQVVDVAPQDGLGRGGHNELVALSLDVERALPPDHVFVVSMLFGDVFDRIPADLLRHIMTIPTALGILTFRPMRDNLLEHKEDAFLPPFFPHLS